MKKIFLLYILFFILSTARASVFADQPTSAEESKVQQARVQLEELALEKIRKEELKRQQKQQLEERIKLAEIVRQETKRRVELQLQERQRQAQLNVQCEAVRKQLENGVEVMYQEAVRLYKQGKYSVAADKFKDIEDILPDYKHAGQYMNDARQKAPSVIQQDPVSKVLDLFEPNVK